MPSRIVTVKVIPLIPDSRLHPDDRGLPAEIDVELNSQANPTEAADVALDVFHGSVAVKVLDNFSFDVFLDGEQIHGGDSHEGYSLEEGGRIVEKRGSVSDHQKRHPHAHASGGMEP